MAKVKSAAAVGKQGLVKLSAEQKAEIKRLTQAANRRISTAFKEYEKAGLSIVPREVVGDIQTRSQWSSDKYAISRSTKFSSIKEYRAHMDFLKSFEPGKNTSRPTMTEYRKIQQYEMIQAIETSIGGDPTRRLEKKIYKMTAPELSKFWERYSNVAARMSLGYASDAAMIMTMEDYFSEDIDRLVEA